MGKMKKIATLFMTLSLGMNVLAACGGGNDASSSVEEVGSSSVSSAQQSENAHVCSFDILKQNSIYHWYACECGERGELIRHEGVAADCSSRPVCATCERTYGEAPGHAYGEMELVNGEIVFACMACGDSASLTDVVDFIVPVTEDREPVVLQLSDPQLMDISSAEKKCYQYIRETVAATNPDLILVTGDLVYGKFDTNNGDVFKDYIAFMESLEKPWAPVFGNHDNECPKGVDWQCEQLENAEHCLFKQGSLAGNGNYSVGVLQNNKLLRVFYMLDSHGCGSPSAASAGKVYAGTGFANNQINWFTESMTTVRSFSATTKFTIACHIQPSIFSQVFASYDEYDGRVSEGTTLKNPLDLERGDYAKEGDFGYLGRLTKAAWTLGEGARLDQLKNLGVDSFFVGHEHCNSVSIVYEGIRFQYGQKSSQYDRYNWLKSDGTIEGGYTMPSGATPLMGGTVLPLSKETGEIVNPYIYYCGNPFGTAA